MAVVPYLPLNLYRSLFGTKPLITKSQETWIPGCAKTVFQEIFDETVMVLLPEICCFFTTMNVLCSSSLFMAREQSFSISTLLELLSELCFAYIFHFRHGVQYWGGTTTRFSPLNLYYQGGYFIRRWSVVKNVPNSLDGWIYISTHFIPLTWMTKNFHWHFLWIDYSLVFHTFFQSYRGTYTVYFCELLDIIIIR